MTNNSHRHSERGSALIYILIAVALLAALSYAVAQSGRANIKQVSDERAKMYATDIIEYSNTIANAVAQLRLRGAKETELCFDTDLWPVLDYDHAGCTDDEHNIFTPSGGGVNWQDIPEDAFDTAYASSNVWTITGDTLVHEIGTTGTDDDNVELIIYAVGLTDSVCQQINGLLELTEPTDAAPTENWKVDEDPFTGSFNYDADYAISNSGILKGRKAGCFYSTPTTANVYYRVLLAR